MFEETDLRFPNYLALSCSFRIAFTVSYCIFKSYFTCEKNSIVLALCRRYLIFPEIRELGFWHNKS